MKPKKEPKVYTTIPLNLKYEVMKEDNDWHTKEDGTKYQNIIVRFNVDGMLNQLKEKLRYFEPKGAYMTFQEILDEYCKFHLMKISGVTEYPLREAYVEKKENET